jgi:hypothetical protein
VVDLNKDSYEKIDQHVMEQLVIDESALATILRGHLFVELVIEELLRRSLPKPDALLKKGGLNFDLKLKIAHSLDVISDEHLSLFRAINKIRNGYAHNANFQVSIFDLNSLKFKWEDIQVQAFNMAKKKGAEEAARIATIFLCWVALGLIKSPSK